MKKLLGFIITLGVVILGFVYSNSYAESVYFPATDYTLSSLRPNVEFNAITGAVTTDYMSLEFCQDNLYGKITKGVYSMSGYIKSKHDSLKQVPVKSLFEFSNGKLVNYFFYLNNELVYELTHLHTDIGDVESNFECFVPDLFKDAQDDSFEIVLSPVGIEAVSADAEYTDLYVDESIILSYEFPDIICKTVKQNDSTKNNDIYYIVDGSNPLDISVIKNDVKASDSFDGDVDVRFDKTKYVIKEDGTVDVGVYNLRAVASDACGNTSFQNILINVIDITGPTIVGFENDTIEVEYSKPVDIDDYIDEIKCSDPSGIKSVIIKEDNYTTHSHLLGTHEVIFEATDNYNNSSLYTLNVDVVDNTPPVITIPNRVMFVEFGTIITVEELTKDITIFDDCDGNITNFDVYGYEAYLAKPNMWTTYIISISAQDKSGNKSFDTISLNPRDTIYPDITVNSGYTIVVTKGVKLSFEDAKAKLEKALGRNLNLATLSSSYFSDENPSGKYEVVVEFEDGTIATHYISVVGEDVSYDIPKEDNNTDTSIISVNNIVIIYIASAIIGIILIMGIVLYKKKH